MKLLLNPQKNIVMQFNRLTVENTPRIQNNSSIDHHLAWLGAMDKGEVPYVYHHVRKGCILQIHSLSVADDRHLMFSVHYGSYFLGILPSTLAKRVQQLDRNGKVYRLTISNILREKYLPPTAIELELEYGADHLADVA
jgi:hypothetical protein